MLDAAAAHPDLFVDVVVIGADSVALDDLTRRQRGKFVRLSEGQLDAWAQLSAGLGARPPRRSQPIERGIQVRQHVVHRPVQLGSGGAGVAAAAELAGEVRHV